MGLFGGIRAGARADRQFELKGLAQDKELSQAELGIQQQQVDIQGKAEARARRGQILEGFKNEFNKVLEGAIGSVTSNNDPNISGEQARERAKQILAQVQGPILQELEKQAPGEGQLLIQAGLQAISNAQTPQETAVVKGQTEGQTAISTAQAVGAEDPQAAARDKLFPDPTAETPPLIVKLQSAMDVALLSGNTDQAMEIKAQIDALGRGQVLPDPGQRSDLEFRVIRQENNSLRRSKDALTGLITPDPQTGIMPINKKSTGIRGAAVDMLAVGTQIPIAREIIEALPLIGFSLEEGQQVKRERSSFRLAITSMLRIIAGDKQGRYNAQDLQWANQVLSLLEAGSDEVVGEDIVNRLLAIVDGRISDNDDILREGETNPSEMTDAELRTALGLN